VNRRRMLLTTPCAAVLASSWLASTAAAQDVVVDPALPGYSPATQVSGSVDALTGMDTVQAMMQAWLQAFKKFHPQADIKLRMQDPLGPEERIALGPDTAEVFHPDNGPYEDKYGYEPFRIAICLGAFNLKSHVSAIGVFVSKSNPIDQISLAALDAIYADARRRGNPVDISTWGQLGLTGEWADKPIHALGFYWRDDVTWYFRDMVDYDAPFKRSYRVPGENMQRRTPQVAQELMNTLAQDRYAIGFANFSYATDQVKPLALVDEHGVLGQPTLNDIASKRYPLERMLYIYVNRRPGQPLAPLLKEFLSFVLSKDGQSLVAADHYLPLPAAIAATERAKLE
jgi:phosphate transport system substrate-binding protein